MLLLDDSSPEAVIVDPTPPSSGAALGRAILAEWPRLDGRIHVVTEDIRDVPVTADDVIVSSHACGALTDRILDAAVTASARVAVLPCCHDLETCDTGPLSGWLDGAMAVDAMRAVRLTAAGFTVRTQTIPATITPKNRLLIGVPNDGPR